jgi:hypothetical protein
MRILLILSAFLGAAAAAPIVTSPVISEVLSVCQRRCANLEQLNDIYRAEIAELTLMLQAFGDESGAFASSAASSVSVSSDGSSLRWRERGRGE